MVPNRPIISRPEGVQQSDHGGVRKDGTAIAARISGRSIPNGKEGGTSKFSWKT